jgi:phenylacetate-CoA ligase
MNTRAALVYLLRRRVYLRSLEKAALYRRLRSRAEIETFQLKRFNDRWKCSVEDVPFFSKWKSEHSLPDSIESLDELEQWPTLTKKAMNDNRSALNWTEVEADSFRKSGGSTGGSPLTFGLLSSEAVDGAANMWIGRMAYGYWPSMRCFLLWGHDHLMGEGLTRHVNVALRRLKDQVMGFSRVSAYDYGMPKLRADFEKMLSFRPNALICYSAAALAFVRANADRKCDVRKLAIRSVICTAGPLSVEEREELSDFFGAPVCMEYGAAETGAMAYTDPDTGNYQIFWDDYIIEAKDDGEEYPRILVTSLMPKYLPLIRYDVGDFLERSDDFSLRPLRFSSVIGRPNESIKLSNGTEFYMATFFECVKQCPKVMAAQAVVHTNRLEIRVVVSEDLVKADISLIKSKCCSLVPSLNRAELSVTAVHDVEKTLAGKVKLVIDLR